MAVIQHWDCKSCAPDDCFPGLHCNLVSPDPMQDDSGRTQSLGIPEGAMLSPESQDLMQAVTLADGTTAYIQHKKGKQFSVTIHL